MAHERMYPCLPCRDIDEALDFYAALGFKKTYRQTRPNPYAVVALEEMHIHLFGMDGFDPEQSYSTVIIAVPDPDALYKDFAAGLREKFGKLPVAGIPRMVRPRKRYGTVYGFSVVDVGGNWLRISKLGAEEETEKEEGLTGIINVAARLGDSHGDDHAALKTLTNGIKRFPDAPAIERARAYLYQSELAVRTHNRELAQAALASVQQLDLTADERSAIAEELVHTIELVNQA